MEYPIIHDKINWLELSLNPNENPLLNNPIVNNNEISLLHNHIAIPMLQNVRENPIIKSYSVDRIYQNCNDEGERRIGYLVYIIY
jgi:hypothetical protein